MLVRYAMLVGVAAAAVWGAVNLGTNNAGMFLVDAGHTGSTAAPPSNLSFWVLGLIAAFITLSLCRFVIFGLPSMVDDWYRDNKSWFYTLIIGALIYGYFYLM
jgi:hypothetical protein